MLNSRLYWLLAVLGLVIIGGGTALYMNNAKKAEEPAPKTESVPVVETTPETETPTTTKNSAAVIAGVDASTTTIGDLSDDISDIDEDTGPSNTDDEKPNY